MKRYDSCSEERFLGDVKDHELTVIRDNGVDRHIRLRRPGTICYGFDLITWPGHLCVTGDCGTFVFARIEDMFSFFRPSEEYKKNYPDRKLHINQGYWAEKVLAANKNGGIQKFSPERFDANVKEIFDCWCEDHPEKKDVFTDIWKHLEDLVLNPEHEFEGYSNAMSFSNEGFSMPDFWECDSKIYDFCFEWCLYAIVWGIEQYDKYKESQKEEVRPIVGGPFEANLIDALEQGRKEEELNNEFMLSQRDLPSIRELLRDNKLPANMTFIRVVLLGSGLGQKKLFDVLKEKVYATYPASEYVYMPVELWSAIYRLLEDNPNEEEG